MSTPRPAVQAPAPLTAGARRLLCLCALVAGLCHLSWIPATGPSRLPSRTSYISEMLALDQPGSWLLRGSDVVAGVMTAVVAVLLWRVLGRSAAHAGRAVRLLTRAAPAGLLLFGLGTAVDAGLLPMSCATSVSSRCASAEAAGRLPLHHHLHEVSSSIASAGALVGPVALAVLLLLPGSPLRARARWPYVLVASAVVATTVWVLVEIAGASDSPLAGHLGLDMVGWSQRAQVTTWSAALLVLPFLPVHPTRGHHEELS